jgi:alanine dehydrogenase
MGSKTLTFGFPRMNREAGERRDFLPSLVASLTSVGCDVVVEDGIGSGMGFGDHDYLAAGARIGDEVAALEQDVVVILRAPANFDLLPHGTTLVSMLHFPTRPARVAELVERGIEAISLDSIEDDAGRRLVVNARAVAWNGLEAAFHALSRTWPGLETKDRPPARVLIMGAGEIGRHAVEAATKYGDPFRAAWYATLGLPGVEAVTIGRNLTSHEGYLRDRLSSVDVLVDATQRHDASRPLIPNEWLGRLPAHAVICDLVVDPYLLDARPPTVRGIEGIPQGDLDRYVLGVDDPAWSRVPPGVPTTERRTVASCYSWPGVHPAECMELYGRQLEPLLHALVECGGVRGLRADGTPPERAMRRGSLRAWIDRPAELVGAPRSDEQAAAGVSA